MRTPGERQDTVVLFFPIELRKYTNYRNFFLFSLASNVSYNADYSRECRPLFTNELYRKMYFSRIRKENIIIKVKYLLIPGLHRPKPVIVG